MAGTNNRGPWTWIPIVPINRPDRTTPESEKDEGYHAACARYYLGRQNLNSDWINWFQSNYERNRAYAIDSLWGDDADIRLFLGDGADQTSRVPFKMPIISPMLSSMVGGADNIAINAEAQLVTQYFAQTRREAELNKRLAMSLATRNSPAVAQAFEPMGISPDEGATQSRMNATFQDHVQAGENRLMQMLADRHKFNTSKRQNATYLALSGLCAAHFFVNGQNLELKFCEPSEVGWDTAAIEPDFSDAEAVWVCPLMTISGIAERWPVKDKQIKALERWSNMAIANNIGGGYWPQAEPRIFTVYWKDCRKEEFGFVLKDGELEYCSVNQVNPDTGKPDYTDKDLQDPPPEYGMYYQAWTKKEKEERKQTKWIERVRYCSFLPWEYMPGAYTNGQQFSVSMRESEKSLETGVLGDMVFDWGECELQEAEPDDMFSVRFPVKFATWRYIGGNVVAPITAAIDSQRWLNQITSDLAWRMRTAQGKSVWLEKSAVAGSGMDEQEINMTLKEGGYGTLDGSAFGGINNAIKEYDGSPGPGFYNMLGQLPVVKDIAMGATQVYDTNNGAPGSPNQLVGTLQIQIQQAGISQQPFYANLVDFYRQLYQFEAQAGKQFYGRRPWLLSRMVGDEEMQALVISRDMMMEQFRVKVDMVPDNAQQRIIVDQQLIPMYMQLGMLDPVFAAQLLGRALPQDLYAAAREYTKQTAAAQAQQAQDAQRQQMADAMAMEQEAIDGEERELAKMEGQEQMNSEKLRAKLLQPMAQANAEWAKPPDPSKVAPMP